MKKLILIILHITLIFTLVACDNEKPEEFNIPKEQSINIQELPYSEYINLRNPVVTITIQDMGDIVLQLFPDVAPNTVNNFIYNITQERYDDNEFHRVVYEFMIQGGRLEESTCRIFGEMTNNGFTNNLKHSRGVLSMARVGGDYNSQSSQFFIVHQDSYFLDGEYTSFGGVVKGFNILDFIASLNEGQEEQIPRVPVIIESITVDTNDEEYANPVCFE